MERLARCIICQKDGEPLYKASPDRLFGVPGSFDHRRCPACGLIWLDPRPSPEELPACYPETYYTHDAPRSGAVGTRRLGWLRDAFRRGILCGGYGYRHLRHGHALCWLGPALALVPTLKDRALYGLGELCPKFSEGTIVDVGCGGGAYLATMRDLGWPVVGIEPDPAAASAARSKGLSVKGGTLAKAQLPDASAAQVSLNHVIEHLPDPAQTVRECHRILKPGGRLVVYTPNSAGLGHRLFRESWLHLDPPRHLFLFSPGNLKRLVGGVFRETRVQTTMRLARLVYDASALISQRGRITLDAVRPQAGGDRFMWKQWLGRRLGLSWGEEIEVVATK